MKYFISINENIYFKVSGVARSHFQELLMLFYISDVEKALHRIN